MFIRLAKLLARTLVVMLVIGMGFPKLSASPIRPASVGARANSFEADSIARRWTILDWDSCARPGESSQVVHVWLCDTTKVHASPESWAAPAPVRPTGTAAMFAGSDRQVRLPEPASLVIVLAGSIGLAARRWLQRRQD